MLHRTVRATLRPMEADGSTGPDGMPPGSVAAWSPGDVRNIVIPLDGSRRATQAILPGRRLAAALGLSIGVIDVVAPDEPSDEPPDHSVVESVLDAAVVDHRLHWWDLVRSSDVGRGISECAKAKNAIVAMFVGDHARQGHVIGATAGYVVEHAELPVMLVGPGTRVAERRPITELVVVIDADADVDAGSRVTNDSIGASAMALARVFGFDIHFVAVGDRRDGRAESHDASEPAEQIADLVKRFGMPGVRSSGSVAPGSAPVAERVARLLRRRLQSLLVLGPTGTMGVEHLRPGSGASRIFLECPIPAVLLPPTVTTAVTP